MKIRATHVALLAIALATPLATASATQGPPRASGVALLLEGGASGAPEGAVFIQESRSGAIIVTPQLDDVQLIPIDFSNRTRLQEFLTDRPRLSTDVGEEGRLILPMGAGSLYAYKREINDQKLFGLMHVRANGRARSVFELIGVGADQEVSPLLEKVAVAFDGSTLLVATKPEAGGNLIEIGITSGVTLDRTANLSPQVFQGEGLALGDGWGFGVCETGILRFGLDSASMAGLVPFPEPQPSYFACEAALSENGQHAVTIAGSSATAAHPFAFSMAGPARCADSTPAQMYGAGYLPNSLDGPFLAINNQGDDCAWVSVEGNSRELYFGKTALPTLETAFQITQDALFHPFLDEIGLLSFEFDKLIFSAGDRRDAVLGGLTLSSYYRAERGAPGTQPMLLDLAYTYESAQPPYLNYTSLDPVSVYMTPTREAYVIFSMTGDLGEISGVRLNGHSGQLFTLLGNIESIEMMEVAGDKVFISVEQENAPIENQLFSMPVDLGQAPSALLSLPDDDVEARTAQGSGMASFVTPDDEGPDILWNLPGQNSSPRSLSLTLGEFGGTLAVTRQGSLAFTVTVPGRGEFLYLWPLQGRPRLLLAHSGSIQILPGS